MSPIPWEKNDFEPTIMSISHCSSLAHNMKYFSSRKRVVESDHLHFFFSSLYIQISYLISLSCLPTNSFILLSLCLSLSPIFSSLLASKINISLPCLVYKSCIIVLMLASLNFWCFLDNSSSFFMISIFIFCAFSKSPHWAAASS